MSARSNRFIQSLQAPSSIAFQHQQPLLEKISAKRKQSCWIEDFYNKSVLGS
ncbi:MAG TPA: hypothetical protein PLK14_05575 [Sediminibacterium sp.]|jgi:hypothetical protein|nr:hypothetical protein [Sediminibacterium sp.]HQS54554.1 hypothetical protein [Sediminibacterium sp.]